MKKGINAWAFPGDMKLCERMRLAADAGYEGIELNLSESGEFSLETDEKVFVEYRKTAESLGLVIPSIIGSVFGSHRLSSPHAADIDAALENGRKMLHIAAVLGADTVLVVPGRVEPRSANPDASYDVVYDNAVKNVRRLAAAAEESGVNIGIENVWNKFLLSPIEMRSFVDYAESDKVGVYFDVGNVMPWGFPEQWIRILGKRLKKIHFKDFRTSVGNGGGFVDLMEGDVNWTEVMSAFREVGYDDFCTAEVSPFAQSATLKAYTTSRVMDTIFSL